MPIPASALKIFAPLVIDKFAERVFGGTTAAPAVDTGTAAPAAAPPGAPDPVVGMVREYFDHAKTKASVRPQIMRRTGNVMLLNYVVMAGVALARACGAIDAQEMWDALTALGLIATGTGGTYLFGHTARSIEKAKGAE